LITPFCPFASLASCCGAASSMGADSSKPEKGSDSFHPAFPATSLTPEQRLYTILRARPFLDNEAHQLHERIQLVKQAIRSPGDGDDDDLIDRLETEINSEQEQLARAFKLFDTRGKDALNTADVKNMNRYL